MAGSLLYDQLTYRKGLIMARYKRIKCLALHWQRDRSYVKGCCTCRTCGLVYP
jgi:hypothetical protein